MNNILYTQLDETYIEEAINLIAVYYTKEQKYVSELPSLSDYNESLKEKMTTLFSKGMGVIIIENGKLIGFIAGYVVNHLFGYEKGIFVPIYGHAAIYSRRIEIEQMLYIAIADKWVKEAIYTHSVATFAHDKHLIDLWFNLGFGNRCVDAIRMVQSHSFFDSSITFEEINIHNAGLISLLHSKHNLFYRNSPIFMPNPEEDPLVDLNNWLSKEGNRMFCAIKNHQIAGYIRYEEKGESVFSVHKSTRNITGLFILPEFRKQGFGEKMLYHVESILKKDSILRLGVDYESINPMANHFWGKHFTPYTYSMVRRIDERIKDIS